MLYLVALISVALPICMLWCKLELRSMLSTFAVYVLYTCLEAGLCRTYYRPWRHVCATITRVLNLRLGMFQGTTYVMTPELINECAIAQ